MTAIWLLPLAIAVVGSVALIVAVRRVRADALPAAEALHRTRTRLSPAIGALRRELRRSGRPDDTEIS